MDTGNEISPDTNPSPIKGGKTLILVRHAKSSWDDSSVPDIERPLNGRGIKDAPVMARRLRDKNVKIDGFYSSPAKRAKKTCKIFAEEYKVPKKKINLIQELYGAEEEVFFDVIAKADDKFKSIAIFSHNPGITEFANELTPTHVDNIPTCGVFAVKADCNRWSDFKKARKEFLFFEFPKGGIDN